MATPWRTQLERSIASLAQTMPATLVEIGESVAGLKVNITLDDERLGIEGRRGDLRVGSPFERPTVLLVVSRVTVLDIIRGRQTMLDAIWRDHLLLIGALSHLVEFHHGLGLYAAASARDPGQEALLLQMEGEFT